MSGLLCTGVPEAVFHPLDSQRWIQVWTPGEGGDGGSEVSESGEDGDGGEECMLTVDDVS